MLAQVSNLMVTVAMDAYSLIHLTSIDQSSSNSCSSAELLGATSFTSTPPWMKELPALLPRNLCFLTSAYLIAAVALLAWPSCIKELPHHTAPFALWLSQ